MGAAVCGPMFAVLLQLHSPIDDLGTVFSGQEPQVRVPRGHRVYMFLFQVAKR